MEICIILKPALTISPALAQAVWRRATIIYCERSVNSPSRRIFANDRDPYHSPAQGCRVSPWQYVSLEWKNNACIGRRARPPTQWNQRSLSFNKSAKARAGWLWLAAGAISCPCVAAVGPAFVLTPAEGHVVMLWRALKTEMNSTRCARKWQPPWL